MPIAAPPLAATPLVMPLAPPPPATPAAPAAPNIPLRLGRLRTAAATLMPTIALGAAAGGVGTFIALALLSLLELHARGPVRPCPADIYAHATSDIIARCFASVRGRGQPVVEDCSVLPQQHCIPNDVWPCLVGAVCGLGNLPWRGGWR